MKPTATDIATPFGMHAIPGPDASVVALLENLLEQAKRGEIVGVAAVVINPVRETMSKWALGGPCGSHDIMAGIVWLQDDFLRYKREGDESQ